MNEIFLKSSTSEDGKSPAENSPDGEKPFVVIFSREEDTLFLLRTLLEMWNYRVEDCHDFEEMFFKVQNRCPALILIDSIFPFDANINAVRYLRDNEICGQVPLIMMSGFSQTRFRAGALAAGANEYLVKPVDFDLLETFLKNNIKQSSVSRQIL